MAAKVAMTVKESIKEKLSAMTTEIAIGLMKSPTLPGNRNTGIKPSIVVKVEASRGVRRKRMASSSACSGGMPLVRIFLRTSWVVTMALSINNPIAIISPKIDI